MTWLDTALEETAASPNLDSLTTFQTHLDAEWIEEALTATGTATLRKRRLPAEQVVWLVLGMAMMRNRPIDEVASKLDLVLPDRTDKPLAKSSIVAARKRLGEEPVRWLFERCAKQWAHASAADHAWRGLSIYAVDGTTLRVPDTDENREHFGLARGHRADSAYPMVRLVALMAVRSHLLAAAKFGPYANSEHQLAEELWTENPDDSLTILDRGFLSAKLFLDLQNGGANRNWLIRAKSNSTWTELETLGPNDWLVELNVSTNARSKDPSLPKTYVARAIRYERPDSKGPQWLLTSLTDPEDYPAAELMELYHERWEIEIGYDEIKTHMLEREEAIRSRTVVCVKQELWGILLAFNLIRFEMEKIAEEADVAPSRISFMAALRLIRDEWMWCAIASPGSIPKKLKRMRERVAVFVLPPRRSDRRFRREVKIKMSTFPKKWRETAGKNRAAGSKAPAGKKKAAARGKATASQKRRSQATQRARAAK
jgi:hypothetical protein